MNSTYAVLIPVKTLATAKSRMAEDHGPDRSRLMRAFAQDAVAAARACPSVAAVYIVTDEPEIRQWDALVLPDEGSGDLNRALAQGALQIRADRGAVPVAALLADLPCLLPTDLDEALTSAASGPGRWFVADAAGSGTTLLVASALVDLEPRFGPGSAEQHQVSGARPVTAPVTTLRLDVDTTEDLATAVTLGVGPHTAALLRT